MAHKYSMRFREIINERIVGPAARPYTFRHSQVVTQTHEEHEGGARLLHPIVSTQYTFKSENGLVYTVKCNLCHHDLEVSFTVPSKTRSGLTAMNGAGDAVRVLATVFAAVRAYLEDHDPRTIQFSALATDRGRVALYDRFCQQAERYFPGYSLTSRKAGMSVKFVMSRPLTAEDHTKDQIEADTKKKVQDERAAKAAETMTKVKADRERNRANDQAFLKSAFARQPNRTLDDILSSDDELLRDLTS